MAANYVNPYTATYSNSPYVGQSMPSGRPVLSGSTSATSPAAGLDPRIATGLGIMGAGSEIFGGQNVSGITYEDILNAANAVNKGYDAAQNRLEAPYNVSGTTSKPGMTKREAKQSSKGPGLNLYAQTVLGMSPADAQAWTKKQLQKGRKLKDIGKNKDVSFKDFIEGGNVEGLEVTSKGGIRGIATPPTYTGRRDPLEEAQIGLSNEIFGAASGLPGMYGEEARAGLNFRNQVRDLLSSQYGTNIDDVLNADVQKIKDISRDLTQQSLGELQDAGFTSSSLTGRKLEKDVGRTQSKLFTDLQGKLAELRGQEVRNVLGAAQVLGGPETFGGFMQGSLQAPSAYGGISDPQSLEAILGQQRASSSLEANRANKLADIYTTGYYGDSGGVGDILGGAVGGAGAGMMLGGPWGAAAGGVLGGIGGMF